jgi:hypothetical protein
VKPGYSDASAANTMSSWVFGDAFGMTAVADGAGLGVAARCVGLG